MVDDSCCETAVFSGVAQAEEMDRFSVKQTLISSHGRFIEPKVKASLECRTATDEETPSGPGSRRRVPSGEEDQLNGAGWFTQFAILLQRSLKERRHEAFNSLRVVQVVAAAVLSGAMWWRSDPRHVRDRLGLLFFITIFWGVFPSFNGVFTFPQERAIFLKERASGMYTLSSYFMARMAGDLPMELALPTVFISVTYWMANLRAEMDAFLLTLAVLLGYVLVAQGLGLALGAAVMDAKQASTVVTVTMLAFLITGGFYVQNIPPCLSWLKYTSFSYYCYRILIAIQYKARELGYLLGLDAEMPTTVSVAVLVGMFLGFRLLAYTALRRMKV